MKLTNEINKSLVVALTVAAVSGCATINRGTTQRVSFNTAPEGAKVYKVFGQKKIHTKMVCKKTPCKVKLARISSHRILITKNGYKPYHILIKSVGGHALADAGENLLAVGILSPVLDGVDALDGADATLVPGKVTVKLKKDIEPQSVTAVDE